ncbi:hypothetical protein [Qipengyuania sediminis]|uniref:hypothetical protein n=1 Tax=Qipengyuania sediminis TaxID=1532023 RepID=UPI00105A6320|nr:hypothetical protein [Qipengyuania sediminis]
MLTHVIAISPTGAAREIYRPPDTHIHALALAADGSVWGEGSVFIPANETYREAIWRYRPGRGVDYRTGPLVDPEPGLGLLRDSKGCTWQLGQAARTGAKLVYRKCGAAPARLVFGAVSDARGYRPILKLDRAGTALDGNGHLLFRDGDKVRRVAADGRAETLASGLSRDGFGLAAIPGGGVLVAEFARARVVEVRAGRTRVIDRSAPGWAPTGIARRGGTLHILEASLHRPGTPDRLRVRTCDAAGCRVRASSVL